MSRATHPFIVLFVLLATAVTWSTPVSAAEAQKKAIEIPAQVPGIGIAAKKPVIGGACKICPWGVVADVVKKALAPYGYDAQVCYNCAQADAPRYVGDARIPPALAQPPYGDGMAYIIKYTPAPPNGRVEMGATSARNLIGAYHGTGNYEKEGPRSQLRLLANINSPLFVLAAVKRSTGITDLSQLKDYKGPPLKIVGAAEILDAVLPYYGTSIDALKAAGATFPNAAVLPPRANADVIIHNGNLSNSPEFNVWYYESQRNDLLFLQFPEDLIDKMARELGLERGEAPVGLFAGMDAPIRTVVRTGTVVYGRADMPNDFAYLVAKALDEQQDLFQWTIGDYSYNRYRVAKAGDVPLHPGAARYYRELGYLERK